MATTIQQYAEALRMALDESRPEDFDAIINNLVAVMDDAGDLPKYEAVVAEYEKMAEATGQHIDAAFARGATANKGLLDELNIAAGPELQIRSKVDEELIGGIVLRVGDTLLDASIKGSLDRLQNDLSE